MTSIDRGDIVTPMGPTMWFVVFIITLVCVVLTVFIFMHAKDAEIQRRADEMFERQSWQPPAIDCSQGQELWDCIRGAE